MSAGEKLGLVFLCVELFLVVRILAYVSYPRGLGGPRGEQSK